MQGRLPHETTPYEEVSYQIVVLTRSLASGFPCLEGGWHKELVHHGMRVSQWARTVDPLKEKAK